MRRSRGAVHLPPVSEWTQVHCARCTKPLHGVGTTKPLLLPPNLHTGHELCTECASDVHREIRTL